MGQVCKAFGRFAIVAAVVASAACDQAQLLAPTNSTITVSAPSRVLPFGGSTEVSAFVVEQGGTPVQNGTTVRFTATLGSVSPVEVQTTNGLAVTTFLAGNTSGIAEVRAISGGATGGTATTGTGTTATSSTTNVVQMTIGAAAVNTVTVRANPGSVGPGGGSVALIATVVAENGRGLEGIPVVFSTDQGTLTSATATTDSSGEARTTLVTSQQAVVSATAGAKTSTNVTIGVRSGPSITITCSPASGTGNCAAVQTGTTTGTATVLFTITRPTGSSTLRSATIDFGDGTSQSLGNLQGGSATVTHTYTGPTGDSPRTYTATVVATDINSEVAASSVTVILTPKAAVTPINVTLAATCETATAQGQRCSFTATVTGGGEGTANAPIESYFWNFDAEEDDSDDTGETATTSGNTTAHIYPASATGDRYTVTVRARTTDGRSGTGRTEIIAGKFP